MFFEFLDTFVEENESVDEDEAVMEGGRKGFYVRQLASIKQFNSSTITVDFGHIRTFNEDLAEVTREQFYRLEPYLKKAAQDFVIKHMPEIATLPSGEKCTFFVAVENLPSVSKLRDIRSSDVGTLLALTGTVTRTSEVRPELVLGTFQCRSCGEEVPNVEQQFKYVEPPSCPRCLEKEKWKLIIEKSTFVDWQRIRVQENAMEIPPGSMPRTIDIIVRNDNVEKAMAGDRYVERRHVSRKCSALRAARQSYDTRACGTETDASSRARSSYCPKRRVLLGQARKSKVSRGTRARVQRRALRAPPVNLGSGN